MHGKRIDSFLSGEDNDRDIDVSHITKSVNGRILFIASSKYTGFKIGLFSLI